MNPIIIYKGPSRFDGKPIVAVIKPTSANNKTGNMATLWVMPDGVTPSDALRQGEDYRVCGDCPLRVKADGVPRCYAHSTVVHKGAMSMYGSLPTREDQSGWAAEQLAAWLRAAKGGRGVTNFRSAAWGDIAALPEDVRAKLNTARQLAGLGARGYTHQWKDPSCVDLQSWHMASVHTMTDYVLAKAAGWRVFFTSPWKGSRPYQKDWWRTAARPAGAVLCPASRPAGELTTCNSCTLCQGLGRATAADVWIPDHGAPVTARENGIRRAKVASTELSLSAACAA